MSLPRVPSVPMAGDLRAWAAELTAYLNRVQMESAPKPVNPQIMHLMPNAKASEDGVLAWDAVNGTLVVSHAGAWEPLIAGYSYGGMRTLKPGPAGADITAAWQKIVAWGEHNIPPVNMIFDFTNDWFVYSKPGLYQVNFAVSIEHNNSGSSRFLDFRANDIDAAPSPNTLRVETPGSTRVTTFTVSFLSFVLEANALHRITLEVSAPSGDYTSVIWQSAILSVARLNA